MCTHTAEHACSCDVHSQLNTCGCKCVLTQLNTHVAVMCTHTAEHACSCDVQSQLNTCGCKCVLTQLNMHVAVMCTHSWTCAAANVCSHCWTYMQLWCTLTLLNTCATVLCARTNERMCHYDLIHFYLTVLSPAKTVQCVWYIRETWHNLSPPVCTNNRQCFQHTRKYPQNP